jgi:hypothetical protein
VLRPLLLLSALAALVFAAPAADATPVGVFNAPGQRHVIVCPHLSGHSSPLRFGDGTPTGFGIDDQRVFDDQRCPDGTVRLDLHELIPYGASDTLAFHRGGNGYADDQNVKYGELATSELADALPAPVLSRGGRGAPCGLAPGLPAYRVDVTPIPREMHYKRPQDLPGGSNNGSSFLHYGDPGADQGSRHDIHYTYLLWSFLNVRGGGIVRTLLAPDQVVRLCDVDPLVMDSWDTTGAVNGQVTARYVRTLAGSCPVYGWMVWSHDEPGDGQGALPHAHSASPPPPADPAPAQGCPVQEAATPPAVVTGGAPGLTDTAATLTGTVDPAGVLGSYRFEYGTDANYGAATAETEIGPEIAPFAVAAPVAGLAPGTTYHYRLVATTTLGTTYGADATLTTSAPPPPPPPARPAEAAPAPPPTPPVALSRLAVKPKSFKRASKRTGTPARIGWTATDSAQVTLTFERRTIGMRVGTACKAPPRAGLPKRAKRCTLWVRTSGALRQAAVAGGTTVRFGGWIGRRALPRGSYRVRALPLGTNGRTGTARYAAFTLR